MKKFSYNDSIKELDEILEQIENSELDLDELSVKVKRATYLLKECKKNLRNTSNAIDEIINDWEE